MLSLGIDTSGPACEVAILQDGACLATAREEMARGQDARLPGLVQNVCSQAGARIDAFDRIGVVTGPGSFTGVRVGVAFARGLALATEAVCLGITSLEAALPEGQQGSAIVILPAQRRAPDITFWAQRFRTGRATQAPEELALADLLKLLGAHPHYLYGEDGGHLTAQGIEVRQAKPSATRAAQLAQLFDRDTHPPTPTYARAPDALLPGGKTL